MIANLHFRSNKPSPLKVTLLIETLMSGQIAASIAEFPTFRVEAATQESAVQQLQISFLERAKHIETIDWEVPLDSIEPAWMKYAGVFKDDADFLEIMEEMRAERNSDDDSEVDPSYYF
jgi:hypothetical protein